ncbi:MAG: alpha/beta hydrolase [Actinomycetota bacterium]|nr:alpha/beta hydrolase [Actinomycetota bacterium]
MELSFRESGTGRPVVLLHAFPLSSAMWLAQREGLSAVCRVITPDQRGFGGTALGHDEPSLDEAADDLAAMLDRLGLDRVVLGGLSMGGYVALAFWRRHRERVAALVLADTKATADPAAAAASRERIAKAVLDGEEGLLVDEVLPKLLGETTKQRRALVLGRVKALVQGSPAYAVAWAERAMAARPDSTGELAGIDVPTLVVVGEEDELSTPAEAEAMAAAIPGARLVRLATAGHLSAVEVPEEFNAAVQSFLAGLD